MGKHYYPRHEQTRTDAILNDRLPRPRQDRAHRDALAKDSQCTIVATGTARPGDEVAITSGGLAVAFDINGADAFMDDIATARFDTLVAGLSVTSTAPIHAITSVLSGSHFALSNNNQRLTLTLPAVAAYSVAADQSYPWTFDDSLFKFRAEPLTVSSVITVVNS